MKKTLFLFVILFAMLIPACEDIDNATLTDEEVVMLDTLKGSIVGRPTITSRYPAVSGTNFPISDYITLVFNEDMNASTINTNTVKVYRNSNNEVVPGRIVYSAGVATFKPIFKFSFTTSDKIQSGLKQDETYKVVLDTANIKDVQGEVLNATSTWTFKTADLDFGIYFMNSDGEIEKSVAGRTNQFFDKSKPTLVYVHGWQKGSSKADFGRECPFFINSKFIKQLNTATLWKNKGWNIAIFYWSQFADEGEVKDAQAKVYKADNDRKDMRYSIRNATYKYYLNNTKTMTELFYDNYTQVFSGYSGEIRMAGHSLGNQLATSLMYKISTNVKNGVISSTYMPKRLAILDPFFSNSSEAACGNRYPGEVCRTWIKEMLPRDKFAFEYYKSSMLGGLIGDENKDERKMATFIKLNPTFMGTFDQADQHCYAYAWYTMSIAATVPTNVSGAVIGAAASNDQVKATSNWSYTTNASIASPYLWNNDGKKTAATTDDYFTKTSGVN